MPNQKQFDTTLQSIRNIDCKLFVLDYDYTVLDEISGKTESVSLSVDAESDIRRTANINIALKDDSRQTNSNTFYWRVGNHIGLINIFKSMLLYKTYKLKNLFG